MMTTKMTTKKTMGSALALLIIGTSIVSSVSADTSTSQSSGDPTTSTSTSSTNLVLQARIDGNYKVIGNFTPLSNVQLYKVVVSYPDGSSNYVFTVPATANSFVDWHAKQNMANTYTISAVLNDGTVVTGNVVTVVMGANGEVTTSDAIQSNTPPVPPVPMLYTGMSQGASGSGAGMPGSDRDSHGCIGSAGYSWDTTSQTCIRPWEKNITPDQINQGTGNTTQGGMQNGQILPQGNGPFPLSELKNFVKNPLTTDEQVALKALFQKQLSDREAIMKDTTLSMEEKQAKMKALISAFAEALLPYIASDKVDAFNAFMAKNTQSVGQNAVPDKGQQAPMKQQVPPKPQALSAKNKAILTQAVNTFPLERLQAILTKVEAAISATKKDKVLAQLNEISDMIQAKIDELTGTSSEDNLLNNILGTNAATGSTTNNTQTQ